MPAYSHTLADEGVVIPPTRLDDAVLDDLVARMRNPDERRGDFRAQLAAQRLAPRSASTSSARATAATASRRRWTSSTTTPSASCAPGIARLPDGRYEAERRARAGRRASSRSTRPSRSTATQLEIDFAGTVAAARRQPQLPDRGHPLGLLLRRPLPDRPRHSRLGRRLRARRPCPRPRAASSTHGRRPRSPRGNVETSCRIVDAVFRAFGQAVDVPAQGQGTMNNVTLGNDRFTYYETIGGGQGACPDADGPSGVHVAMSNTLEHAGRGARARRIRCASSATRCAPARAARARTAAATASSASCACSRTAASRSSPSGARDAPQRRAGRRRRARRVATCVNGEEVPAKETRDLGPATSSRSRRRAAAAGVS